MPAVRARHNPTLAVVAAAMLAAALLLAHWGRGQWFGSDDLGYTVRLATQPLGHALLHPPPNKYLIAVPLLLYDGLLRTFGFESYVPYRVLGILLVLLCAGLLFVLLRRRLPDRFAIPPMLLMLFFGAGAGVVLTPTRIPSQIALATGLGMLLALERRDRTGDLVGMMLLGIALASHPLGISFAGAAAVMIVLRGLNGWRALWVVAIPGALFAIWWFFIRPPTLPSLVPNRASDIFPFVRQSWAALTAAVTGLFSVLDDPAFHQPPAWIAAAALLALIVLGVAACWKRLPPTFWAALVGLLVLMATTRLSPAGFLRAPDEARYLYPEAFLLLIALGTLAGTLRLPDWAMWGASAVLVISLWPNIDRLVDTAREVRASSDHYRAEWSAVEIAGSRARPEFRPDPPSPDAAAYLTAVRTFGGGGGYSPETLAGRSNGIRYVVDSNLVAATALALSPTGSRAPAGGSAPRLNGPAVRTTETARGCLTVAGTPQDAEPAQEIELVLPPGGVWLGPAPLPDGAVKVGRFADRPMVELASPPGAAAAELRVSPDRYAVPWKLGLDTRRPLTVCGLAPPSG